MFGLVRVELRLVTGVPALAEAGCGQVPVRADLAGHLAQVAAQADITVAAGQIGRVLRITELKESAAMTVSGASTSREYEQGVTGLGGRPVSALLTGLTPRL